MKILFLTQWYPPEPALLIQELAQELLIRGHEVTVLTGYPNYPSGKLYPGYHVHLRQSEILGGVPVVRVPLFLDHSQSKIRRALNYVSFTLSSAILGFWQVPRPNVMFVYHPPLTTGLSAWILSRLWGIRFVYQIQDMWPETLEATGMIKSSGLLSIIGRIAKWIYAKAHTILVISPGFKRNLLAKGVAADKIRVVSNWVEGYPSDDVVPDMNLAAKVGMAGRFKIVFAGNMGEAQGLETVLESATILKDDPNIQFILIGDGIALPRLKDIVRARSLSNVKFPGRFPHAAMPALFALADVLLVHLKDEPLFRITIPHKLINYLGSGKPVIAAVSGDAAQVITDTGAGVVCPPGNPHALAAAIRDLENMAVSEREKMGQRGLLAAAVIYSRSVLVAEIDKVLTHASIA
jgi:glycosyltransferase involved in cell wall biosynthesis